MDLVSRLIMRIIGVIIWLTLTLQAGFRPGKKPAAKGLRGLGSRVEGMGVRLKGSQDLKGQYRDRQGCLREGGSRTQVSK